MRDTPGLEDWRAHVQSDPIAEAVAAERARAAQAVREIVETCGARVKAAEGFGANTHKARLRELEIAEQCLAAVEGKR